ncbi:hypothetical protein FSP39_002166 [Pinctada imbricata]|uniref:Phosducin domain-containing protein n=1 Tax=Pinctada imbricata TaxID=66713 RepID=A0AA89C0H2_PINIB|nr:hypothetical protein FSP39_002166 [Pinctada imbricata]
MALSLDDKLLGEKVDNYCSSDEGERDEEEEGEQPRKSSAPKFVPEPELKDYQGFSTNVNIVLLGMLGTGPKGVINDWREFKRLESERRECQEKEKMALAKKLQMTCRSHLDDEKEKKEDEKLMEELQSLEDYEDEFLKEYRQKRIEEMRKALQNVPKFGKLLTLSADSFLEAIDKENKQVVIIIHVYEDRIPACQAMNGCLSCLAQEYPTVKFCKIKASDATLSMSFAQNGVPALLVYKSGELIGNFIRMSDEFGEDFFATDLESFLAEHSFLPAQDMNYKIIKDSITGENRTRLPHEQDSDSDFDVD